jgi:hypothetical protein
MQPFRRGFKIMKVNFKIKKYCGEIWREFKINNEIWILRKADIGGYSCWNLYYYEFMSNDIPNCSTDYHYEIETGNYYYSKDEAWCDGYPSIKVAKQRIKTFYNHKLNKDLK